MFSKESIKYFLPFFALLWMSVAHAEQQRIPIFISVANGIADLNKSGFDNPLAYNLKAGMEFKWVSVAVGYLYMDKFKFRNTSDTSVGVKGITLSVEKPIQLRRRFFVDLIGGLYHWDASSKFLGREVGSDKGTNVFVGVAPRIQFGRHFSLFLGAEQYFDVSGSDIARADIGVSFKF